MNFKFSIIIPIHRKHYTIQKCLNSILNQTYKNFEIICILDDASVEDEQALETYKILKYKVNYKNPGLARNEGLKYATGDFIGFIDADDYIFNSSVLYDINSQLTDTTDELVGDNNLNGDPVGLNEVIWNKVYKRDFLNHNNLFFTDNYYGEDNTFNDIVMSVPHNRVNIHNNYPYYVYSILMPGSVSGTKFFHNAIGFVFEGCGASYAAHQDIHWLDIDTKSTKDNEILGLAQQILHEVQDHHYGVFVRCNEKMLKYFNYYNLPINIIIPSISMKEEILNRILTRDGVNDPNYQDGKENYDKYYELYSKGPNAYIYRIGAGEFVSMYLPQLNQINEHLFTTLHGTNKDLQ